MPNSEKIAVFPSWNDKSDYYKQVVQTVFSKLDFDLSRLVFYTWADKPVDELVSDAVKEGCNTLLFIGADALNHFTSSKKIDEYRSKPQNILDIPSFACYSPAYLERGDKGSKSVEDRYKRFELDIYNAILSCEKVKIETQDIPFNVFKIAQTFEDIETIVEGCKASGNCSFDIETSGFIFYKHELVTLSITYNIGSSYVIPFNHKDSPFSELERVKILNYLSKNVFNNPEIEKFGWNTKFDMRFLGHLGVEFSGKVHDGIVMLSLIDENIKDKGLKNTSAWLYPQTRGYDDDMDFKKVNALEQPLDKLCKYNAMDSDLTLRCSLYLLNKVTQDRKVYNYYNKLSLPALKVLYRVEMQGMLVDFDKISYNQELSEQKVRELDQILRDFPQVKSYEAFKAKEMLDKAISELVTKITEQTNKKGQGKRVEKYKEKLNSYRAGTEPSPYEGINFGSPTQLGELLYSNYGFGFQKIDAVEVSPDDSDDYDGETEFVAKTVKGSTAKAVLIALNDESGFVATLLEMRSIMKLKTAFLDSFKEKVKSDTSTIHTQFKMAGTVTGRLASADPNLQQVPRATKTGALVKEVFVAPIGYSIVQADLSQAELRIAAKLSGDPAMTKAYAEGKDIHTLTAQRTMRLSDEMWEKLSKEDKKYYRTAAKAVNFGFLYGMSAEKFRQYAKTQYNVVFTEQQAFEVRENFFKTYKDLLLWHRAYRNKASQQGYVETLFGRKRRLPDIYSQDMKLKSSAERQAINSPVQGTGGEYTIFSLVLLDQLLPKEWKIVNTVHDSIILYVPDEDVAKASTTIKEIMENLPLLENFGFTMDPVGMVVDIEAGKDWANLTAIA